MTTREFALSSVLEESPKYADQVSAICTICENVYKKRFADVVKCCRNRKSKYVCRKCSNGLIARNPRIRQKIIETQRKTKYPSAADIKKRFDAFVKKAIIAHGGVYDYSQAEYTRSDHKIKIVCKTHGSFFQLPYSHLAGRGCSKCGKNSSAIKQSQNKSWDKTQFISVAESIHNKKFLYSSTDYTNAKTKVAITCPTHGVFYQTPNKHIHGAKPTGCPNCVALISREHTKVNNFLNSVGISYLENVRDLSQHEIDIWIQNANFGIEVHGCYWHGCRLNNQENHRRLRNLHHTKATEARSEGFNLYQFWDYEINNKFDIVKSMVQHKIGLSKKVYARKTSTHNDKNVSQFLSKTHMQGHRNASINYCLEIDDEIMAALTISKHPTYEWEIIRFSQKLDYCIVGGFSKLLAAFIKDINPSQILTYANRRFGEGEVYLKSGFQRLPNTKPNYFYYKGNVKLSRQQCQKKKLLKLLGDNFNPNLSETNNMLINGYSKVYDAGNAKYLWAKDG